jgi:HEPN domain-containing protein
VDAQDRIIAAVASAAHADVMSTGMAGYFDESFDEFARAAGGHERDGRRARQRALDLGLLYEHQPGFYRATMALLLLHEQADRQEAYRQNAVRRHLLEELRAIDQEADWATFRHEEGDAYPATQEHAAAEVLDYLGLVELKGELPTIFNVKLTSHGRDVLDDSRLMQRQLPVTSTEDDEAHAVVAPDALGQVIRSCEEMLEHRGWENALDELRKADNEYRDGDWVNAVRDYYSTLESGLKYALHEEGKSYSEKNALSKLAGRAAAAGLIPEAYKMVFSSVDAIRSPRSHGAGPKPPEKMVEVGQAEALLIGNLARSLLLYVGNRPQIASGAAA